jgi:hypothetical protein
MGALFTVSYWIVLVTVIPGTVTIATVTGAFAFIDPALLKRSSIGFMGSEDWLAIPVAVTIMILTQSLGILLEEVLISRKWLGRKKVAPQDIDCYEEYDQLYHHLAEMKKDDDAHGHLRRAITQFFLTLNTLVSFLVGMSVALAIAFFERHQSGTIYKPAGIYLALMGGCFLVSYLVARIRFREMARSIWTARQRKGKSENGERAA